MASAIVNAARRVLVEQRASLDGRDPSVVHLPASAFLDLHRAIALSVKRVARQIITVSSEGLNPDAFEHVVWREAARSGLKCERIYLIPHAGYAVNTLQHQLDADRASGIDARYIIVSRIPFDAQPMHAEGLWILDEEAVAFARGSSILAGRGSVQWTVSSRQADVRSAVSSWECMWELADEDLSIQAELDLEEPLVLTADLLNGVSPVLCTNDHIDDSGCDWYHGTWQYLRLLQLVSTPTWHHDFYRDKLREALHGRSSPRAIITGTADYSMLAYLFAAAHDVSPNAEIHVIDQCATPLFACRWYAKRNGFDIVVHEEDLLDYKVVDDERFDVLCTDAFLTRFTGSLTSAVVNLWMKLLKPGGRLVTTIRVHQRSLSARDPESAINDFRERAVQRAKRWEPFLHRSSIEIGELAEVYARTMQSNPVGDEAEIRSLIENAGFRIDTAQLGEVPGELAPTISLRLACTKP